MLYNEIQDYGSNKIFPTKNFPGLLATGRKQNEAIGRALEAVRLQWIDKQLKKGHEDNAKDQAQGQRQRPPA